MYKNIMLKISGESLAGDNEQGFDFQILNDLSKNIKILADKDIKLSIVLGGGNFIRGSSFSNGIVDRVTSDYMGMLGTVINALALGNTLKQLGVESRVMTSMSIPSVAEPYLQNKALSHLEKNRVLIFGGGTGNPFFSTDTTASLRAAEISADLILMAKNGVDGVYDKDPSKHHDAKKISSISYAELINQKLEVIDLTAAAMCDENDIDMILFDMNVEGNILRAANDEPIGTKLTK